MSIEMDSEVASNAPRRVLVRPKLVRGRTPLLFLDAGLEMEGEPRLRMRSLRSE